METLDGKGTANKLVDFMYYDYDWENPGPIWLENTYNLFVEGVNPLENFGKKDFTKILTEVTDIKGKQKKKIDKLWNVADKDGDGVYTIDENTDFWKYFAEEVAEE